MLRYLLLLITFSFLLSLSGKETDFQRGQIEFTIALHKALVHSEENLVFSPLSIWSVLGMCQEGAEAETRGELLRVAGFQGTKQEIATNFGHLSTLMTQLTSNSEATLILTNAAWVGHALPVSPSYQNVLRSAYRTHLDKVDFSNPQHAANVISRWIAEQSRGRLQNVVKSGSIDPNATALILTSTLYFNAPWNSPFPTRNTKVQSFSNIKGQRVNVPFMKQQADFLFFEDKEVQILQLPYLNRFAMVIVLPRKDTQLAQVESGLSPDRWEGWINSCKRAEVTVELPRFTLGQRDIELTKTLQRMGIQRLFSPSQAQLQGISPTHHLFVTDIRHATYLRVDEAGTEAAATTVAGFSTTSLRDPQAVKEFRADRPFLFGIVEKQKSNILLFGRLTTPEQ